jgi:hypothetical protein
VPASNEVEAANNQKTSVNCLVRIGFSPLPSGKLFRLAIAG